MNLLNKLTIKNLKLNKKRTIVTIIGIMLSVALITAVASMYASGIKSLIALEKKQMGNFHIALYDISEDNIEDIKNINGIEEACVVNKLGYAKLNGSKNDFKIYADVNSYDKCALKNLSVNLIEGRLPENNKEIVIPKHLQTNGRIELHVGDKITLDIGKRVDDGKDLTQFVFLTETEKIIDTIKKEYTIVGVAERPSRYIEPTEDPGYTFITVDDKISEYNDMYIYLDENGRKDLSKICSKILGIKENTMEILYEQAISRKVEELDEASKDLEKAKYFFNINQYLLDLQLHPLKNGSVGDLVYVVIIVFVIIVFTSVFCIKNSFDISITEKNRQYGMLRSIGATKKQIRRNVLYEATVEGVIGISLGLLLGLLATFILLKVCALFLSGALVEQLEFLLDVSPWALLLSVLLGFITIYLSAIKSAFKASKVSPIDSIRNSNDIKIKAKKMKSLKLIKKMFGVGGDISYKNLKRNKRKYRVAVISIAISSLTFIALSYFMSLAFAAIEQEVDIKDYNVSLTVNSDDLKLAMATTTSEYVDRYSIVRHSAIDVKNFKKNEEYIKKIGMEEDSGYNTIQIYSIDNKEYEKYLKKLGLSLDETKDKIIMNDYARITNYDGERKVKETIRETKFKEKDIIELTSGYEGKEVNNEVELVKITNENPFGISISDNCMNCSYILVNEETGKNLIGEDLYNKLSVDIYYDANNSDQLQKIIDEELGDREYSSYNRDAENKILNNLFTLIGIFLYGFIIVVTLIGVTNIFNTITTSVELRKREFATLKSVGMTSSEFNHMIRLESVFMGTKALIFGIPVGIILSYFIYNALGKDTGLSYNLPIKYILLTILGVFLLISFIMKYSVKKVSKQNIIETIRNENI